MGRFVHVAKRGVSGLSIGCASLWTVPAQALDQLPCDAMPSFDTQSGGVKTTSPHYLTSRED